MFAIFEFMNWYCIYKFRIKDNGIDRIMDSDPNIIIDDESLCKIADSQKYDEDLIIRNIEDGRHNINRMQNTNDRIE